MDDDLQHPPEELPKMISVMDARDDWMSFLRATEGHQHSWIRKLGRVFLSMRLQMLKKGPPITNYFFPADQAFHRRCHQRHSNCVSGSAIFCSKTATVPCRRAACRAYRTQRHSPRAAAGTLLPRCHDALTFPADRRHAISACSLSLSVIPMDSVVISYRRNFRTGLGIPYSFLALSGRFTALYHRHSRQATCQLVKRCRTVARRRSLVELKIGGCMGEKRRPGSLSRCGG